MEKEESDWKKTGAMKSPTGRRETVKRAWIERKKEDKRPFGGIEGPDLF